MRRTAGLAALALVGAGCAVAPPETLRVLAAASLGEAFAELGRSFEGRHPGEHVAFTFAASSTLARQVASGAPGHVLATADEQTMARVPAARLATEPVVFARNRLAVVTPRGNPQRIGGLADLVRPGLAVVLCAPEVPCGRAAADALGKAAVDVRPASLEENAKAVVARVALGEADAGLAYATDARAAAGSVDAVDVADAHNVTTAYPIAVLRDTTAARTWVDHVLSPHGQQVLARFGFSRR